MKLAKFVIALALFVTSVNYQEQVIVTKSGIDVTWKASIVTSQSFAAMEANQFENAH